MMVNNGKFHITNFKGQENLLFPYTCMGTGPQPLLKAVDGNGVFIKLHNGKKIIDAISSGWCMCHGHKHPNIIDAMGKQLHKGVAHAMFSNFVTEQSCRLAHKLANLLPNNLDKVFLCSSGTEAVEAAFKIAVQFWNNCGVGNKSQLAFFRNGYHGDTMACMSISDPASFCGSNLTQYHPKQFMLDMPKNIEELNDFEHKLAMHKTDLAGVIIEPIIQCAAGPMKIHSAEILGEIYRIVKKHKLLLIVDETSTGFGRTGSMFAFQQSGVIPDILILGKALTGGMAALGAIVISDTIFQTFNNNDLNKVFMHNSTFLGNQIACAAANASIELFNQTDVLRQVKNIESQLKQELIKFKKLPKVTDIRVKGAIGVIELDIKFADMIKMRIDSVKKYNVWLRPFGNVLYTMPPFIITPEQLTDVISAMYELIAKCK